MNSEDNDDDYDRAFNEMCQKHRKSQRSSALTDDYKVLVLRLNAAAHDERLSTGALYLEAAAAIKSLSEQLERAEAERDAAVATLSRIIDDTILEGQSVDYYKRLMLVWREWCSNAISQDVGDKVLVPREPTDI